MKTLYIIAGPNGAGKTTASITMLPEIFWLPKPEIAVERVKQRVLEGGHSIPEDVILRRYHAGIDNFFKIFMERVDS